MKILNTLGLGICLALVGCSKDKNMDDYRRSQLQENLARISAVSGTYTGNVTSKIDGTNLGAMVLKFQARTDVRSASGQNSTEQVATVSGSLSFKSVTNAEIAFNNGTYDDITGELQVKVMVDEATKSELTVVGIVRGGRFIGALEVFGQPEYGGELNLMQNAPLPSVDSIEVGGIRLQQVNKMNYSYEGFYRYNGESIPFKLKFSNPEVSPKQKLYGLFTPVKTVEVNCNLETMELNFKTAILDDKAGTLVGRDPIDQVGKTRTVSMNCLRFDDPQGKFGWNCEFTTKTVTINTRLEAKM